VIIKRRQENRNESETQSQMNDSVRRRFTLFDLLIVIAWTSIGFWLARVYADILVTVWIGRIQFAPWRLWLSASYMVLLAVNLCIFNLRLMPPRPSLRKLAREPGFLAGAVVPASVLFETARHLAIWLSHWSSNERNTMLLNYLASICVPIRIGPFVILAWMILFLQQVRPSRSGGDWIEHLGRVLGCVTILSWVVSIALLAVPM
jgi:hypothetical protein